MILTLAFWMILPAIIGTQGVLRHRVLVRAILADLRREGLPALLGAVVNVTRGGLVIYGGFFGGVVGLLAFFRKYRVPLLATADLVAPSLMLGLAWTHRLPDERLLFGGLCELPWAVSFPPPRMSQPPYASQVARGVMYGFRLERQSAGGADVKRVTPLRRPRNVGLRPATACGPSATRCDHGRRRPRGTSRMFNEIKTFVVLGAGRRKGMTGILRPVGNQAPAAEPRGPSHAALQQHRRTADLPALAGLRSLPPPRRGTLGPDADRLRDHAILGGGRRTDEPPILGTGMTVSQNVSLLLLLAAMGLWYYVLRQGTRKGFRDLGI